MKLSELGKQVIDLLTKNGDKDVYVATPIHRAELKPEDIYLRDIRKCKYVHCDNYSEDAVTYCCDACASDDHER